MNEDTAQAWVSYGDAVRAVYRETDDRLVLEADASGDYLQAVCSESDRLTDQLATELREGEALSRNPDLETAVLAAAAVDATVGADLLSGVKEGDVLSALDDPEVFGALNEIEAADRDFELPKQLIDLRSPLKAEPLAALIARANRVFGEEEDAEGPAPIAGGAAAPEPPKARAERAIDKLFISATPVAIDFGTALIGAGVGTLAGALADAAHLHPFANAFKGRLGWASRLVVNAAEKLDDLIGTGYELAAERNFDDLEKTVKDPLISLGENAVARLARVQRAAVKVDDTFASRRFDAAATSAYDCELTKLCEAYADKMRLAATIAKCLRKYRWVPIVVSGAVGLGALGGGVLAALNGVGFGYSLYSLMDRLDTSGAVGWVKGVQTLLETHLLPPGRHSKI